MFPEMTLPIEYFMHLFWFVSLSLTLSLSPSFSSSSFFSPSLKVPIKVTTAPRDTTVIVGDTAAFVCTFSSFPTPSSIQWFKEEVSLPLTDERFNITTSNDSFSSELSFEATPEDNDTKYFCRGMQELVTGEVTEDSESATLTIQSK